jgi:hypothetical protein
MEVGPKKHHGVSSSAHTRHGGLTQLQSNATDFPGNDPGVIQVHLTSAKKDIIGQLPCYG